MRKPVRFVVQTDSSFELFDQQYELDAGDVVTVTVSGIAWSHKNDR